MESVNRQSMMEILTECLEDSNLETVSKAELRKKYLEKTGLTKLPHEDKKLFTSAVNTAYLNYVTNKTATAEKSKNDEASNDDIKESNEDWKLEMSCSDDEDITPGNITENVIEQFADEENNIEKTSATEIKESNKSKMCITNSSPHGKISPGNIKENADNHCLNGVNDVEMESSSDVDEKASHKNIEKSPSAPTLSGKKQRAKRALTSSSEDETIQLKPTKRNKILKKARQTNDLEVQSDIKSGDEEKVRKIIKNRNISKKAVVESSDSEDEPLNVYRKKSNSLNKSVNLLIDSDESENDALSKVAKKQSSNPDDSKNHSSDSEDEPLVRFEKSSNSIHSNGKKQKSNLSPNLIKSKIESSDGSDTEYKKGNDSIHSIKETASKRKLNSSNKFSKSFESTSGSEDESLAKSFKKKVCNTVDSSDSENEPLNNFKNNKKMGLPSGSKKKQREKIENGKGKHSLKKPLTNKSKEILKKKKFVDSDDDSDEHPIATLAKKTDPANTSLKSAIDSSDSENEPLNNLNKAGNPKNFEKSVKRKIKQSLKKPGTNKKSKEQTLKKKRYVDSDDDASVSGDQKEKSFNRLKDSLLSDSSEDVPLSNMKEGQNDSENEEGILSQKKEKSFNGKKDSLLSDSSEDEPLSNIKKANSSSDSEDEALIKLSTEKCEKKENSGSASSSFVDENEEQSSRKNKLSKKKEANDSGKGKKRPSASENKIEHLKKYLRVAGIRISNYNKLFENCKSVKAKCEKMMSLLEKEGLKGRPTLEKCKKLRVKIETKREIAELDMSNILKDGGGRPKRSVCSDTTNCKRGEEISTPIKFSRLQDIVDSEESE